MKQDDWTQALRSRLNDREATVPDDLWSKIEERLDANGIGTASPAADNRPTAGRRRHSTVRLVAWAATAAATVALLVTLGYQANEDTIRRLADNSPHTDGTTPTRPQSGKTEASDGTGRTTPQPATPVFLACDATNGTTRTPSDDTACEAEAEHCGDIAAVCLASEPGEHAVTDATGTGSEPKKELATRKRSEPAHLPSRAYYAEAHTKDAAGTRWSVGAHTSGTFTDSRSQNFPAMSAVCSPLMAKFTEAGQTTTDDDGQYDYMRTADVVLCSKYSEVKHHAQPISVGLSVGYALSGRLSLTSGVVYTRTSSDFIRSVGNDEVVTSQKRHYIGVPLGLKCRVWGNDRAHVYATAGAQADFNVAARQTESGMETTTDKDRVQMSANVAAGIQLNIMPKVGLYAEPGVKRYFDNHSSVETVFKEKPWTFSLQLGMRVDL